MQPAIALIGRPNVGKSTLFNRVTKTRDALVADFPGLTRDRKYGEAFLENRPCILIDTGGIGEVEDDVEQLMSDQTLLAIEEADVIVFIVDGREGITAGDEAIAQHVRLTEKPLLLVVNKTDNVNEDVAVADFYSLGLGEPIPIAAAHGRGVRQLMQLIFKKLPAEEKNEYEFPEDSIKLAMIGRPNVGKSTLVNRFLGEDRVVVYDMPGTTRDSIKVPLERNGRHYTLIDTAGVRRRGRVKETVEKFSIVKTLQSIEEADIVLLMFDAQEGITDQDLHILGFVMDAGKGLVLVMNKWDGLDQDQRKKVKIDIDRRLDFINFARIHTISALHGTGVGDLFRSVHEAYHSATKHISTAQINTVLERALKEHQPPLVHGRRIKLRYGHMGGQKPPLFILHGNQTEKLPPSYQRYLINFFRKAFKFVGTPIRVECVTSDNPYKDRKNVRTARQVDRRRRAMKHYKSKK